MQGKHRQRKLEVPNQKGVKAPGHGKARGPGNIHARIAADLGTDVPRPGHAAGAAPASRAAMRSPIARLKDTDTAG